MGNPDPTALNVLDWWNALYVIPLAVSGLLLVLSSLRLGGHHGGHSHGAGHHHDAGHIHSAGHGGTPSSTRVLPTGGPPQTVAHHGGPAANVGAHAAAVRNAAGQLVQEGVGAVHASAAPLPTGNERTPIVTLIQSVFGFGRAPIMMVVELFFICSGALGLIVNELLVEHVHSGPGLLVLSAPIAFFGGLVLARVGAALLDKLLPREESLVTSRDSLFGLAGEVTYPVGPTGGRIHVYDAYGTLHDEACRAADGAPAIPKGATAIVEDIDRAGNLIVREIAG